jgi:hypothetical protein
MNLIVDSSGQQARVDVPPRTDDLDLVAVDTSAELLRYLEVLRVRAGKLSSRVLAVNARRAGMSLSKTTASKIINGSLFPSRDQLLAFVRACNVPPAGAQPWVRAWERVMQTAEQERRQGEEVGQRAAEIAEAVREAEREWRAAQIRAAEQEQELRILHLVNQEPWFLDMIRWAGPPVRGAGWRHTVIQWSKAPGDRVEAYEPLATFHTEGVIAGKPHISETEVKLIEPGVLQEIFVGVGETFEDGEYVAAVIRFAGSGLRFPTTGDWARER